MPVKPELKFTGLYFPGLISMACLPLLFVMNVMWTGKIDKQYRIEIVRFSKSELSDNYGYFTVWPPIDPLKVKATSLFVLDRADAHVIITDFSNAVYKLANSNDSTAILKVSFTSKTSYKDFLAVFDTYRTFDTRLATLYYENECFVYKTKQTRPVVIDFCGSAFRRDQQLADYYNSLKERKPITAILPLFLLLLSIYVFHFSGLGKLRDPVYRQKSKAKYYPPLSPSPASAPSLHYPVFRAGSALRK